jgi:hypothetical protein
MKYKPLTALKKQSEENALGMREREGERENKSSEVQQQTPERLHL